MSQPKQKDLDQIAEALNDRYGFIKDKHGEYFCENSLYNVVILDNYVPDLSLIHI